MSKPSDYTASNYQMILNSEPKGTLTEVPLSKLKAAGSIKGYNGHFNRVRWCDRGIKEFYTKHNYLPWQYHCESQSSQCK